jgi:hypothetical protein
MQLGLSLDDNPAVSLLTLCFGWLLTLPMSIEICILSDTLHPRNGAI